MVLITALRWDFDIVNSVPVVLMSKIHNFDCPGAKHCPNQLNKVRYIYNC